LKALTLWQPWAWLVASGHKDIENRPRTTSHRGPFLVHAGKTNDVESAKRVVYEFELELPDPMVTSSIIGVAVIEDVVDDAKLADGYGTEASDWAVPGEQHYLLDPDAARLFAEPIPHRGYQNFWTPDDEVTDDIRRELDKAGRTELAMLHRGKR
jgi:hypothetical protein